MAKAKVFLRLTFWLILIVSLFSVFPSSTNAEDLKWSGVNLPSDGQGGKWVLAGGSDVRYLTQASDGTLYCYANPAGTTYRLFKSADGGYSWTYTGKVEDDIVDIAILADDPNSVYYATESKVYKSTDAGTSFELVARNPGGAGAANVEITSIDVDLAEGNGFIVIGTRDTDPLQYGGVYTLDESQPFECMDTAIGNYDVYVVAFSPDFAADRQIVAVATDETDTIIPTRLYNRGWDDDVGEARITGLVPASAAIAFPADYSSNISQGKYTQYIALNAGGDKGDVYCLKGKAAPANSKITDLNAGSADGKDNLDITSLAVSGDADKANLTAGAAATAQVYFSEDAGKNWMSSEKPPTGDSNTFVLMAPDFATSGIVYAATSGADSAFSVSRDKGISWSQASLIDTKVTTILDLAVSPDYNRDATLFLLTADVENSLWYSSNGGIKWERLFCSTLPSVDRINLVAISPQYSRNQEIFLAGVSNGAPVIWRSQDNGKSFLGMLSNDPDTGAAANIDAWVISPEDIPVIGSFDGTHGVVYQTADSGIYYSDKAVVGTQVINSITLSPDYGNDKTILVGGAAGGGYYSKGNFNFETLPSDSATAPLSGAITVAFDPDFTRNKTVYAADDTADKGIYRFVIGKSTTWESIDGSLPAGAKISQVATSNAGILYAVNLQTVDNINNQGGIERALDPTYGLGPSFETVTRGLDDGVVLKKLWIYGDTLWTIDSTNAKLLTYNDSAVSPVTLTSPADNAPGQDTRNITISWKAVEGATGYHWQLDTDKNFSNVPTEFQGDSDAASAKLPALDPDTLYYWRVRATGPVKSPWSDKWSFTTRLSTQVVAPELSKPEPDILSPVVPKFVWTAFAGADRYELVVARDEAFSDVVINRVGETACKANAWESNVALEYGTTYYWKVRAVSQNNNSDWSAVSIFTTEPAPKPSVDPSPSPSPLVDTIATPASPSPTTPSPTSTPPADSLEPTIRLLFFLVGGLVVLTIVLVIVVVFMLKKFRSL